LINCQTVVDDAIAVVVTTAVAAAGAFVAIVFLLIESQARGK